MRNEIELRTHEHAGKLSTPGGDCQLSTAVVTSQTRFVVEGVLSPEKPAVESATHCHIQPHTVAGEHEFTPRHATPLPSTYH